MLRLLRAGYGTKRTYRGDAAIQLLLERSGHSASRACRKRIMNTRPKKRCVYTPRIVGDKVMMPADLERLHKYMLEIEHIDHISDEMRAVVEELWAELAHKLPPKPG